MARKIPASTVRKGLNVKTGKVKVTKPPRGIAAKLADKALKAMGK